MNDPTTHPADGEQPLTTELPGGTGETRALDDTHPKPDPTVVGGGLHGVDTGLDGAPSPAPAPAPAGPDRTDQQDQRDPRDRQDRPERLGIRVRTVVFGLVMAALAAVSLVALLTDIRVDGGVVGLALLIGAGAALVAGGIASARRESRGGPGAAR